MRRLTPRLRGACSELWKGLTQMYDDYVLWQDRRDDARCAASAEASADGSGGVVVVIDRRMRENANACPRSVLVIPADGIADACRRHRRSGATADAVVFDLTCCKGRGGEARDGILRFLQTEEPGENRGEEKREEGACPRAAERGRYLIRVNSPELDPVNGFLDLELAALLGDRIEGVLLPAVTVDTYSLAEAYIHPSHRLWASFDTPLSVVQAPEICRQGHYHYAVVGPRRLAVELQLPMGKVACGEASSGDVDSDTAQHLALLGSLPLLHCSLQVLLAARAFKMHVLDGAFDDASDTAGFRRDVHLARSLGFDGKLVVHPAQLAPCHAAFAPTEEEVAWARRVQQRVARRGTTEEAVGKREATQWRRAASVLERQEEAALPAAAPAHRSGGGRAK
ncbi:citrate lyase subunit beta [Trypanosoma conorhini]|uniref:Citrate lyase subunit beta n=1 Tax=Trypanosoma conorhini TaxID=83891 RepID=A0A3R7M3X7_9TRYP|nr:citrate lyase subunit beta [Trypanosoma conorhini]RNF26135.1 citrate lyase subunit beta [Trypanosoma conorhini]